MKESNNTEQIKKEHFRTIVEKELISPVYQPIVSQINGEICGYEALSRIKMSDCSLTTEELFHMMSITAEGVETSDQVSFLKDLHCSDIQGYFFSKPLPFSEYEAFAKEHSL